MTDFKTRTVHAWRRGLNDPRRPLSFLLALIILAVGVGAVLYYITGPAQYYMTSDSTDSLRWAQASYESGKLISEDFYYAAILPFGGNLIFAPFIAVFGYSVAAQLAGLVVYTLLLVWAMYYMATGIGLKRVEAAALVSLTLLILSSSPKLREIMWEHIFYYNLGILFFCLGVGLVSRLMREDSAVMKKGETETSTLRAWAAVVAVTAIVMLVVSKAVASVVAFGIVAAVITTALVCISVTCAIIKPRAALLDWIKLSFLAVFSMLAATNGLQTLVCFALPVFAGMFAERLFDDATPIFSRKNLLTAGVAGFLLVGTLVGYSMIESVTAGVTAGYQEAYSSYSAMGEWTDNLLKFMINWFSLIGVSVVSGDPLMSSESVINMLRIFGGMILLVAPVVLLFFWKRISSHSVRIALIGHFAVSAFIVFAVVFGKLGGANWRLTPMLGTSVVLSFVTAIELIRQKKVARRVGALLLAFMILLALPAALEIKEMQSDDGDNVAWHTATDELIARGLRYGYANFWFAETITMLSDGELEVSNIREGTDEPQAYAYQLPKNAFADRPDATEYFLLLTEKENSTMRDWLDESGYKSSFIINTEGYNLRGHYGKIFHVYVFSENIF